MPEPGVTLSNFRKSTPHEAKRSAIESMYAWAHGFVMSMRYPKPQ